MIFRIARHASAATGHAIEAKVLPALAPRLPLAVPYPEWRVEPGAKGFPFGAIGHRRLAGEALSARSLERLGHATVASHLAAFLSALHRLPPHEAELLGVPRADRGKAQYEAMRARVMPALRTALTGAEYATLARWWDAFSRDDELERFQPALRHGDLWYGNVLVDESERRLVAVLDWENVAVGDPARDFASQYHLGEPFASAVLAAYAEAGGPVDESLRKRVWTRWELREFAGIGTALELDDADELEDGIGKLRAGPILAGR